MKSYSEQEGVFSPLELEMLSAAKSAVEEFPYVDSAGRYVRCHEVARAVLRFIKPLARGFEPRVVDGKFDGVDHSWIAWRVPDGYAATTILDPYAVGSLPQVQIHKIMAGLRRSDYKPDHLERSDIREDVVGELVAAAGPESMPW